MSFVISKIQNTFQYILVIFLLTIFAYLSSNCGSFLQSAKNLSLTHRVTCKKWKKSAQKSKFVHQRKKKKINATVILQYITCIGYTLPLLILNHISWLLLQFRKFLLYVGKLMLINSGKIWNIHHKPLNR